MPLRRKLLVAMLTPALLLGTVGVLGVTSLLHLEQAAGRILSYNYATVRDAREMERAVVRLSERSLAPARRAGAVAEFEGAMRRCQANLTERGEGALVQQLRAAWAEARAAAGAPGRPLPSETARALHAAIDRLVTLNERAMFEYERDTDRRADLMIGGVGASVTAALVALALFASAAARRIAQPVVEVSDRLHEALNAGGDAGARRRPEGDEIQRLREELDALLARLAGYEAEQQQQHLHLRGRLAAVMNEVRDGIVLVDDARRVRAINPVARRILELDGGEGRPLAELELRGEARRLLGALGQDTPGDPRLATELRCADGEEERIYQPRVLPLPNPDGRSAGWLVLLWDVTEQRRFEAARQRFISTLSHQLKTPMTSLSMAVSLLRERLQEPGPAERELLAIAAHDCATLSRLAAELVEASHEGAGLAVRPRRLDLTRLLLATLRRLRPQAQEKGVELRLPPPDREVFAAIDPVKFPWVVTNIAGNALRYTERGGSIAVTLTQTRDRVVVEVRDSGVGMRPDSLQAIFEPYVSADREPHPGTHGLGLAIAREIVEAHGGSIVAASELGAGTTFRIELPRAGGAAA